MSSKGLKPHSYGDNFSKEALEVLKERREARKRRIKTRMAEKNQNIKTKQSWKKNKNK